MIYIHSIRYNILIPEVPTTTTFLWLIVLAKQYILFMTVEV